MNQLENKNLKELLDEFLEVHYSGSFSRMVSEYIRATGMTETEREALVKAIRRELANYKDL